MNRLRILTAALLGGAWGGAIVGLAEAGLLAATAGSPEDYWLFPYAVMSYGLMGMTVGLAYATLALAMTIRAKRSPRNTLGRAAASALLPLGIAVTRYHVIQRIFHEELLTTSTAGIAVHGLICVAVGGLALLLIYLGRGLQGYRRGLTVAAIGLVFCLALTSAAAVLASPHVSELTISRSTQTTANGHPNIILIIADTLRTDALGVYGAPATASPALDRFAAEAVRFESAYSQSTWTRPSIATILTSLYPSTHGLMHKMDALPDQVTTLAEALRAEGYWTAGFVSNINVAPVFNFQQGFHEYTYLAPAFYFGATDSATRLAIYKGLRVIRERFFGKRIYFYHYYQDAEVVNAAVLKWLDQRPPNPFFLLIHYMDPHDPYFEIPYDGYGVARVTNPNPPAERKNELRKLYAEDVTYLDQHLGVLISRLRSLGLYDTSVLALTADHGEEFLEHGGWWHGTTLYQEQVHVPLILRRPREPRAGEIESRNARTLDIAPTLMAAAGLRMPTAFAGRDLFGPGVAEQEPLFAEEDLEGNVLASIRLGPWKIITANAGNPRGLRSVELYNLGEDPGERHDLAPSDPARAAEMIRLLATTRARLQLRNQP